MILTGCAPPGDASVLVSLPGFENELTLREARATLDVLDAEGRSAAVELSEPVEGAPRLLQSPIAVPCTATGVCAVGLRLAPGSYRLMLHIYAQDRCGTENELLRFSSDDVEVVSWGATSATLSLDSADFDADGDDIPALFELMTCGRFDQVDRATAPSACLDKDDPCCQGTSPLEGRRTAFAGGPHTRADGSSTSLEPFALDATEATWRQLARCVAAGACLLDQPAHPARVALEAAPHNEPAQGLNPAEAAELCAFMGARLPLDDEWDFAAAHRERGSRGRYPWDGDDLGALIGLLDDAPVRAPAGDGDEIGCDPGDPGISANHRKRQAICSGAPRAVGSFPSSHVRRGAGVPLADLGGNVAEWTIRPGGALRIPEVPEGAAAVVLRGGGATSLIELLENDIPVVARPPSTSTAAQEWAEDVARLSEQAGVRCAISVDDGTAAPGFLAEPLCGP